MQTRHLPNLAYSRLCRLAHQLLCPAGVAGKSAPSQELQQVRRQGHSVPESLKQVGGSATIFVENNARRLSHAEKVRTMLAVTGNGTMSTLHHESGWPYGSILNFATEERAVADGGARIITFISRLAEHTANLLSNPRCSLLLASVQGSGDRLATARATILAEAKQIEKTSSSTQAFLTLHPNAFYVHFEDFLCFEFKVRSVRYIGGFGEMSWVDGPEYEKAELDPVSLDLKATKSAVDHCNEDHADAVLAIAKAFSGLPDALQATMLSVDRYGFDVLCQMSDGLRRSRVEFTARLDSPDQLRVAMVELTNRAREALQAK